MKLFIAVLFLFLIAGLLSTTAKADEDRWEYIGQTEGINYYYDKETLTNPSRGVVKVWMKSNESDFRSPDSPLYVVFLIQLKCNEKQYQINSRLAFYEDENKTFPTKEVWENITPHSAGETWIETLCNDH